MVVKWNGRRMGRPRAGYVYSGKRFINNRVRWSEELAKHPDRANGIIFCVACCCQAGPEFEGDGRGKIRCSRGRSLNQEPSILEQTENKTRGYHNKPNMAGGYWTLLSLNDHSVREIFSSKKNRQQRAKERKAKVPCSGGERRLYLYLKRPTDPLALVCLFVIWLINSSASLSDAGCLKSLICIYI